MDDSKVSVLRQFIQLGWALIPLHNVTPDGCSCTAGPECPVNTRGKHPRNSAWQSGGWVREVGVLESVVRDRPQWNWGAVCGPPSGVWVLDVDPEHGGRESLAELERRVGASLGAGRRHGTGSGGEHLIFKIGPDGWTPQTGSGRFGPGLDVRAAGGQIVLPSSVSAKGPYVVLEGGPLEVVRADVRAVLESWGGGGGPAAGEGRERLVVPAGDQGAVSEGGERYARAVVEELLVQARDAVIGTRNDTAYRTAVRIWELVRAPWCSLTVDDVQDRWWAAAGATGAPDTELWGVWTRAYGRAMDGEVAVLPESAYGGERVPLPGSSPGASGAEPAAMGMTVLEYRATEEGRAIAAEGSLRSRFIGRTALGKIPRPVYLIEDTLNLSSDSWLIGASGSYKSFVALDWACHVATGKPWAGRRVRRGTVWCIVAEGISGIDQRITAWEQLNGAEVGDELQVLPEPVYVTVDPRAKLDERLSAGWKELVETAREDRPALIVLDTQSRMTIGLNENDNSDMAFWADAVAALKQASGACVLVVHHTGRKGGDARGGSAIDAAQDDEWTVSRGVTPGVRMARLVRTKSKDSQDGVEHALSFDVLTVGEDDDGRPVTSLGVRVLPVAETAETAEGALLGGGMAREAREEPVYKRTGQEVRALQMYRLILETAPDIGASEADIRKWLANHPSLERYIPNTRITYAKRAFNDLCELGLIMKRDGRMAFRAVELPDQSAHGALTPNPPEAGWMAPDGWSVFYG